MMKKTGIWRFAGPLRITAILLAALYGVLFLIIWGVALVGSTELVFDMIDLERDDPLEWWQFLGGFICSGIAILAIILIAITVNRLLKRTKKDGFFEAGVAETLRRLGWAMILFWLGLYLVDSIMPWLLTLKLEPAARIELDWFPLDDGVIALLVGFVLLLVSQAMHEAREIDADNKQII
jgi:hypothetical protein